MRIHQEGSAPGPASKGPPKATGGRRTSDSGHTRRRGGRQNITGMTDKKIPLKIGTWNVRTMQTGLDEDLRKIDDSRKTAIINNELNRLNIDICALQETRLPDTGNISESNYTFFYIGKPKEEKRMHGVGFAVRNNLLSSIDKNICGTERICKLKLSCTNGLVHLISAYAPTLHATDDVKDGFYENLDQILKEIPQNEQIVLLGDFNARIGSNSEAWPICMGPQGHGQLNDNGQRLLELCTWHKLCITNSYFQTKPWHKVSWQHPRTKVWHQIDYVITRKAELKNVNLTRSYHSADCDTDHSLVVAKMNILPRKTNGKRNTPGKPKLDISRVKTKTLEQSYNKTLRTALDSKPEGSTTNEGKWKHIRNSIYESASSTFGKRRKKQNDWFNASVHTLQPAIDSKRKANLANKKKATRATFQDAKEARKTTRRLVRRAANFYWTDLAERIQYAAENGNIRALYEGIKEATGPTKKKSAPLKTKDGTTITNKDEQMSRWAEHYCELLGSQTKVTEEALLEVERLPSMLELDDPPSLGELSSAIDHLPTGKAAGMDAIAPELVKSAKDTLLEDLHELLTDCWEDGDTPQEMRDCKIITIYKNKGLMSDCNNYRGISLLSIIGKTFARVALKRLQRVAEEVYPESQCGFRANRSTNDMIFSIRQLQEKCREQRMPLYMVFIDLTKAFDLVSRDGLFKILDIIGCPPKLLRFIQSFHDGMKGVVEFDGSVSDAFEITSGVKQGCVLAPTLFGIFFATMLHQAFRNTTEGVYMHTRMDGDLFNLQRLRSKKNIEEVIIRDLLFADDAAIVAHTAEDLQTLLDKLSQACTNFGLTISIAKTKVMVQGVDDMPDMKINNNQLEIVQDFTYLGSLLTSNLSLEKEIDRRIGKAYTTLSRLTERVWENNALTTHTRILVYKACVLSTLLYGSECWCLYSKQERRLNAFHMKCLRRILGIKWTDMITNNAVLEQANIYSLTSIMRQQRLRWLGHITRMENGRIPKQILFGQLARGTRRKGRPLLRYKDILKKDLLEVGINPDTFAEEVANRDEWKVKVKTGIADSEERMRQRADEKRLERKRKEKSDLSSDNPPLSVFTCPHCQQTCQLVRHLAYSYAFQL